MSKKKSPKNLPGSWESAWDRRHKAQEKGFAAMMYIIIFAMLDFCDDNLKSVHLMVYDTERILLEETKTGKFNVFRFEDFLRRKYNLQMFDMPTGYISDERKPCTKADEKRYEKSGYNEGMRTLRALCMKSFVDRGIVESDLKELYRIIKKKYDVYLSGNFKISDIKETLLEEYDIIFDIHSEYPDGKSSDRPFYDEWRKERYESKT